MSHDMHVQGGPRKEDHPSILFLTHQAREKEYQSLLKSVYELQDCCSNDYYVSHMELQLCT